MSPYRALLPRLIGAWEIATVQPKPLWENAAIRWDFRLSSADYFGETIPW